MRKIGIVLDQFGALYEILVDLQLLGKMLNDIIFAGIRCEFADLHPTTVVAYDLQSIRITIVAHHNEVVLLRVLLVAIAADMLVAADNGLIAKLEVLLVHASLDLIDTVAHLIHLLLDGLQFRIDSFGRLISTLITVERYHRILLYQIVHGVIDVNARTMELLEAIIRIADDDCIL